MDSEEENFNNRRGGDGVAGFEEDDGANKVPDYAAVKKHYKILKKEDIKQLQENDISTVSSSLSVSRGVACTILCRNNWCLRSACDECFADDEINRRPVGILGKRKSRILLCNTCNKEIGNKNMVSAACRHPFCDDCWKKYITTSINDGPGCLTLPCPEAACQATVGLELINSFANADYKDKYYRYLRRSYVETSRNRKWCPAPGCDLAIEFDAGKCKSYDVTCDCSHKFCWNCLEESHRPLDCKTVAKWIKKISSAEESINWILAYTKRCPKCELLIEKIDGCYHMTCRKPCGFEFCWICLEPWKDHDRFDKCPKYEEGGGKDEEIRINAKKQLERYTHYYERWDSNDKSRKRALIDLNLARKQYVNIVAEMQGVTKVQLQFVIDAWEHIVECRRVLKWTYAYGYYLSLENSSKMNLFESFQGLAEAALEKLHHCAETEMDKYIHSPREDFKDFRTKLANLTGVTRNYFENLVMSLENNLSDVES